MATQEGFFISGICAGFIQKPWKNDPSKFNYSLGVARSYQDDFGMTQTETTVVSVSLEDVQVIAQQAERCRGKHITVRVVPQARSYKDKAFLSFFMPAGEKINLQAEALKQAS